MINSDIKQRVIFIAWGVGGNLVFFLRGGGEGSHGAWFSRGTEREAVVLNTVKRRTI